MSRESLKNAALEINQLRRYSRTAPDKVADKQMQKDGHHHANQARKPAKERGKDGMELGN